MLVEGGGLELGPGGPQVIKSEQDHSFTWPSFVNRQTNRQTHTNEIITYPQTMYEDSNNSSLDFM